eukprot:403349557
MQSMIENYLDRVKGRKIVRCQSQRQMLFGPSVYTYDIPSSFNQQHGVNFDSHMKQRSLMDSQSYLKKLAEQLQESRKFKQERKMNIMIKMELKPNKDQSMERHLEDNIDQFLNKSDIISQQLQKQKTSKSSNIKSQKLKNQGFNHSYALHSQTQKVNEVIRLVHCDQKRKDLQRTLQNTLLRVDSAKMSETRKLTQSQLQIVNREKERLIMESAQQQQSKVLKQSQS